MIQKISKNHYSGIIAIPPSKSDSQRAILCDALSGGTTQLSNVGSSDDELAMLQIAKQLIKETESNFFVGESGLATRLITPILCLRSTEQIIIGHGSIERRDFSFFEKYLPKMGVEVKSTNHHLPIRVTGPLVGGDYTVDGSESSQYISGLLMALPLAKNDSILTVENLKSSDYVKMTLATVNAFGIEIKEEGRTFKIKGNQVYKPTNYTIDGDWSSASCWLIASALGLEISISGLSMKSLQADKKILDAFFAANCRILKTEKGISIDGKNRQPFEFDATNCPDLFPALAVFAGLTSGKSTLKGVNRLANKESDRGLALQSELGKLGIAVELMGDEMIIHGVENCHGNQVNSHQDHRIAMCLGIAGMFSEGEVIIENAEVVGKSYPGFWEDLGGLKSI